MQNSVGSWLYGGHLQSPVIFPGDEHHKLFDRLEHLQLDNVYTLFDLDVSELKQKWDETGHPFPELSGPGPARSQVVAWHRAVFHAINGPETSWSEAPPQSSLANSQMEGLSDTLKNLGKAFKRVGKRRVNKDVDSESEAEEFDLGDFIRNYHTRRGDLRDLPSWVWPDTRRLRAISKKLEDAQSGNVPFLVSSSLEEWNPSWIGSDLSKTHRENLVKDRSKDIAGKGFAIFLQNVVCFLMCHLALRQLELPTILAYIMVLARLSEERSVKFAFRYHQTVQHRILEKIKRRETFSIDGYLTAESESIVRKLEASTHSKPPPRPDPVILRKPDKPVKTPPAATGKEDRRPICFSHKPHEGVNCSDKECKRLRLHLDTSKPADLERFNRAHQAHVRNVDLRATRGGKGASKGAKGGAAP